MRKKAVHIIVSVLLLIVVIGFVFIKKVEANLEATMEVPLPEIDLAQTQDGIYEGSYGEIPVSAKVSVTVEDHVITEIKIIEHLNGQGKPAEVITGSVVEAQSLKVDMISGATYSSKVILMAIGDALK